MNIDTQSVASLTIRCMAAFSDCQKNASLLRNQWAENRLADFSLWAHGVGALAASQASLDAKCQSEPSTLMVVKMNLLMLEQSLNQCVDCAERAKRVDEATTNVDSALENLNLLAVAIRRTSRRAQLEKADQNFDPENHTELATLLKILLCCQLGARERDEGSLTRLKKLTTEERVLELQSAYLSSAQERLLQTNLRRRNRFLQAQKHIGEFTLPEAAEQDKKEKWKLEDDTEATEYEQVDTKKQQDSPEIKSPGPAEATITGSSAPGPESSPSTERERMPSSQLTMSSIATLAAVAQYPKPPKIRDGLTMFKCPCCCQTLPVEVAIEEIRWK